MLASEIFKKKFEYDYIISLYMKNVFKFKNTGLDKVTPEKFHSQINDECMIINRKVFNDSYRFTMYKELLVSKGKYSFPRSICIPTNRDKLTLLTLNENIKRCLR